MINRSSCVLCALLLLAMTAPVAVSQRAAGEPCDRACLRGFITSYLDALKTATAAMTTVPERSRLASRDEAIRIAQFYPAGLRAGSFVNVDVPSAAAAYRFENGRLMAGPGCTFMPGCDNIKTQKIPTLRDTTPRLAAVDEDLGIVWFRLDFGAGSTQGTSTKLIVWEAFKVYGGQIHAVEAFMETVPMGAGSGWD